MGADRDQDGQSDQSGRQRAAPREDGAAHAAPGPGGVERAGSGHPPRLGRRPGGRPSLSTGPRAGAQAAEPAFDEDDADEEVLDEAESLLAGVEVSVPDVELPLEPLLAEAPLARLSVR